MIPLQESSAAEEDLSDIFAWIAQGDIEIAEHFLLTAENTFQFIALHPGIGRERFEFAVGLRSWRIQNFELFGLLSHPK